MKSKKVIIIILVILAIGLIGGGTWFFLSDSNKEPQKEEKEKKKYVEPDPVAEQYKVNELKTTATPDKKIRFSSTVLYRYGDTSSMSVDITPFEDFEKVYILLTMKTETTEENIVVYLENLKKGVQIEHEIHSLNDWSLVKSWSIKIITEDEARALGFALVD